jgi:hypothetical protein
MNYKTKQQFNDVRKCGLMMESVFNLVAQCTIVEQSSHFGKEKYELCNGTELKYRH